MNLEYCGEMDQHGTTLFGVTDFERVRDAMGTKAADYGRSMGWKVGGVITRPNVERFLREYMTIAGGLRYTAVDKPHTILVAIKARYSADQQPMITMLWGAFLPMANAGEVPSTILAPWTYERPASGGIGGLFSSAGEGIDKAVNKLLIVGVIALLGYGAITTYIKTIPGRVK